MESSKLQSEAVKEQPSHINSSQIIAEATGMRRDNESIDDFEHLEPESSPIKETVGKISTELKHVTQNLEKQPSDILFSGDYSLDLTDIKDELPTYPEKQQMDDILNYGVFNNDASANVLHDNKEESAMSLSSSQLLESTSPVLKDLTDSKLTPTLQSHAQHFTDLHSTLEDNIPEKVKNTGTELLGKFEPGFDLSSKMNDPKVSSQSFMDIEKEELHSGVVKPKDDKPNKFVGDSEFLNVESVPELDLGMDSNQAAVISLWAGDAKHQDSTSGSTKDEYHSDDNFQDTDFMPEPIKPDDKFAQHARSSSTELKFQDVDNGDDGEGEPSLGKKTDQIQDIQPREYDYEPIMDREMKKTPEPKPNPVPSAPELDELKPIAPASIIPDANISSPKSTTTHSPATTDDKVGYEEPEQEIVSSNEEVAPIELFSTFGLDAWFQPERLHPKVVELVYWRDPKKSGAVFGGVLGVLLSLSYFSLISVIAYLSLILLTGTICFRVYKNVLQAVQKTSDGHPFKEILDIDLCLPQDRVREVTDVAVAHINAAVAELRRLFLVEDLVDSIKFGVLLWCLTYLGSWFNGMTLIIISFVAMFTLPKVYENNKAQIDQNLDIVRSKLADITSKVKAAVPIGKKPAVEEKKEQ